MTMGFVPSVLTFLISHAALTMFEYLVLALGVIKKALGVRKVCYEFLNVLVKVHLY